MTAPWVQTASGGVVDLLDPRPSQINLFDIARSLSRIPRFNGHTRGEAVWTVAAHSLLVADIVASAMPPDTRLILAALLHDAHEAYMGDLISPMKAALGYAALQTWRRIEQTLQAAIHDVFGLPAERPHDWNARIKHADLQALELERMHFMTPCAFAWADLPAPPPGMTIVIGCYGDDEVTFTDRALKLLASNVRTL